MNAEGNVALVTGAAKRIGRAIALELARAGCDIAVHYGQSQTEAEETAAAVRDLGRKAAVFHANLAEADAAGMLPKHVAEEFGRLDILVNNASVFEPMTIDSYSLEQWNRTLAINLTAPMILSHAAYPYLKKNSEGRIVNLGDIAAERPWPGHIAYCVSKGGLCSLTQTLAKAMAPDVRVNAIAPGAALFPDHFEPSQIKAITRRVPSLRAGTPEEIASAVRFFVVDCDYITGTTLAVDGGRNIAW